MKKVSDILEEFGVDIVDRLTKSLDKNKSNASYNLRQSIDYSVEVYSGGVKWKLILDDYYKFVDQGRPPGKMPPIESLDQWITDKGIRVQKQSGANKLKRRVKKSYNSPLNPKGGLVAKVKEQPSGTNVLKIRRQMAWAFAYKIAKKGTKGNNFYSEVITPRLFEGLYKELQDAAGNEIEIDLNKWIDTLQ